MLAVQRYRPEKYPPADDFAQFGDSFLKRGVAAHTAAVQKLAERRYSDLHSQRLNEKGFVMMSREDFPRSRRDSWSESEAPMHQRNDEPDPRDPLAPGVAAYNIYSHASTPHATPQASPRDSLSLIRRRQDDLPHVGDSDMDMEDARSVLSDGGPVKKVSSAIGTLASGVGAGLGALAEGAGKGLGAIT